jgi:hypothetical protein
VRIFSKKRKGFFMQKFLIAIAALLAMGGISRATTLDPLHGYDIIGGVDTQTSNGSISPLNAGDGFGFIVDQPGGGNAIGDFILTVLVPTNLPSLSTVSVTGTSTGTGIFKGIWLSGDLETFLGLPSGSPNNPIGAFTGSVDLADPTVSGFAVFAVDLGNLTLLHTLAGDPMNLNISGLPAGTLIAGFLVETGAYGVQNTIDTANSSVLMVNQLAAVPGPIVGAGLPGLITMAMGLFGLNFWRRKRRDGVSFAAV